RNLIRELGRERTVILSTHILQEVTSLCQRVAIINNGRLVVYDSIDRLSDSLSDEMTLEVRLLRPERLSTEMFKSIEGIKTVEDRGDGIFLFKTERDETLKDKIAKEIVSQDAGLSEMRERKLSLEDVFLKVVSGQEHEA
ncbi:MAG: hypothetical protein D6710_05830, partial [Nitrospirae bacterium]